MKLVAFLVAGSCAACVPVQPQGYHHPRVEGITIITAAEGTAHQLEARPMTLVVDATDTDAAVEAYLRAALRTGARHVSALSLVTAHRDDNGQPIECVIEVGPREEIERRMVVEFTSGRTEYERRLVPRQHTRTEYRRECRMVSRPHTRTVTEYRHEYDYRTHQSRSVPTTRTVTDYRYEQECSTGPHVVTETRYEYVTEATYVPPQTSLVSRTYSRWELVESRPRCTADDRAGPDRVEGAIYVARDASTR